MSNPAWKRFERWLGKALQDVVGPTTDGELGQLVTQAGRVGQYYDLQFDVVAGNKPHGVAGEAKRHQLPKWFKDGVVSITKAAAESGRLPLLAFQLANDFPQRVVKLKSGASHPIPRVWVAVPSEVFFHLLYVRTKLTEAELEQFHSELAALL